MEQDIQTSEGMTVPLVAPEVPRRQRGGYDMDLTQHSVGNALRTVGGLDPGRAAYLVASEDFRDTTIEVGAYFKLPVVLLPPEMLSTTYAWAVVGHKGTVFSTPTP